MSNMVYLICSLPSLTFGQSPPISLKEFHQDAKNQLSTKQYKKLEEIDIKEMDGKHVNGELKEVTAMLNSLQKDFIEIRKARSQNRNPNLNILPKNIIDGNPLEREKEIMKWQWEELNAIESGKTFTLTEVLVYKLKLQILTRLHSFDPKQGLKILDSIVNPSKKQENGRDEN